MMLMLNAAFAALFWHWANNAFENGMDKVGWLYIVVSAWNAASVAVVLF